MQFGFHLRTVELFKTSREYDLECVRGNVEIYFPVVAFVAYQEFTMRRRA